jgi:hypothetical protein
MKLFNKDKLPSSEAIRYAEEQTKIYKQQVIKAINDYIQLQSNWNSLREWLIEESKDLEVYENVLDKMNELEKSDNK